MRLLLPPVLLATLSLPVPAQAARPPEEGWDGEWQIVVQESDRVETLIEQHLRGENFAMKLFWRRKLSKACRTYANLDLLYGEKFGVTFGRELPADTPTDGGRAEWTRSDGERFQLSFRKEGTHLVQTLQGKGYTLTNAYALGKEGRDLKLQVTCTHPKRKLPFTYRLFYRKAE